MTLVAFSGDLDKQLATLSLATSAAAMGAEVRVFFTFWGLSALRKRKRYAGKSALHKMLHVLLPSKASRLGLSRKNMLGAGPVFFRQIMKRKHVSDVHELVEVAREVGVKLLACQMSLDVMGLDLDELVDGVEVAGAASCVNYMMDSQASLFV